MNKEQTFEVLEYLEQSYGQFGFDQKKLDTWAHTMRGMDFKRVMAKAEEHVMTNRFPPSIAEIAAYAPPKNEHLEQMEQWKRDSEKVSDETKERYRQKFQELMEAKANG